MYNSPIMGSTETQRNYLQKTDPLVRKAISTPKTFSNAIEKSNEKPNITQVQAEAIVSGMKKVADGIGECVAITADATEEEQELVHKMTMTLWETKGQKVPLDWFFLFQENPQRAVELFTMATERINIVADWLLNDINVLEYTASSVEK